MSRQGPTILWLRGDLFDEALAQEVSRAPGFEVVPCPVEQLEGKLPSLPGGPPAAAVVDTLLHRPLRAARRLYQLSPLSHILFLAGPERLAELRREVSLAPMIGTHWSVVEPRPKELLIELERATRAAEQRRHLRTTLGNLNLRIGSERPPRDSVEYQKLVVSDKYLATILEHAHDAIVSLSTWGRVASWNRGAVSLFGHSPEESASLELDELIAPGDRGKVKAWFEKARQGTATLNEEIECLRRDGTTVDAEATLAPVRDDSGEVVAVSLTARDVTERKRAEDQLRRLHAQLEERVAQRTAELERLNSELEAFTYSASHDLRAPLRGIDGFSQALMEDYREALDDQAAGYIERIRSAARRMGEIIDALLLLSRISQARLQIQPVDLGEMTRSIVADLHASEPDRDVDLEIAGDLRVHADAQLMRIALENLLGNAWKFTRERARARIEVGRRDAADDPVYFVRDNGAGFDMAYQDKLFVPFQRLHDAHRFEGTGIGLGTVQRIIRRHGGKVWAKGVPGEGATFYFRVPSPVASADVERVS